MTMPGQSHPPDPDAVMNGRTGGGGYHGGQLALRVIVAAQE